MALFSIFDIAGSSMSSQSVRLNTTVSNMANANTIAGSADEAYKGRHPIFQVLLDEFGGDPTRAGVGVSQIVESQAPARSLYQPEHPLADADGYVYLPNVNVMDEMVNMLSAARAYQNSVEVLNTSKQLLLRTISAGQ